MSERLPDHKQKSDLDTVYGDAASTMSHELDLHAMTLRALVEQCAEATQRFFRELPHDNRYCFELFTRALVEQNQEAWGEVYLHYTPLVGISVLAYPPTRGNVWTDWTATSRKVRGRGMARALKLETVMQAIGLGTVTYLTGEEAEATARSVGGQIDRAWNLWKSKFTVPSLRGA